MLRIRYLALALLIVTAACRWQGGGTAGAQAAGVDASAERRFGVIESYEDPAAADALGVGWTRVEFNWAEIQPDGPDQWMAPVDAATLAGERAAGRELVGLLIGIPDWARDGRLLPAGLYAPLDDATNTWAAFVRQAVGRHPDITHWIIWNEPDIWNKEAVAHTWDGDEADFARLLKVAYLTARDENTAVRIHLPAFTYFWDANFGRTQYLSRLLDALAADPDAAANNYYFDIATAHLYFQPAQIMAVLTEWQTIMREHGLEKPFWLVETNAPPVDDPAWPVDSVTLRVLQPEQAAFIPQALAVALALDVERIAVFKLRDTESDRAANPEPFGLVRQDGSRRPAFDTYAVAIAQLAGVWGGEIERWNEVGQIRLDQPGQSTTVVFARLPAPQSAEIPATGAPAVRVDQYGNRQTLEPVDGYYVIDLGPAICAQSIGDYCMIGGETIYVIQPSERQPPTPVPPPTEPAAEPSPTVPAIATPAGTATPVAPTATALVVPPPPTATPWVMAEIADAIAPTPTVPVEAPPTGPTSTIGPAYLLVGLGAVLLGGIGLYLWRR